jgi:hypothetical protein
MTAITGDFSGGGIFGGLELPKISAWRRRSWNSWDSIKERRSHLRAIPWPFLPTFSASTSLTKPRTDVPSNLLGEKVHELNER